MKDLELVTAWGKCRKGKEHVYLHEHDFYELVYYCDGEGSSIIGDKEYAIASNICVIIPPHVPHEEYHLKDNKLFCIGFHCDETFDVGMIQDFRGILQHTIQCMVDEVMKQPILYREMAVVKLHELLLQIKRLETKNPRTVTKDFEYVIGYLSQNYHEKIVLKDMAEQLNLSYDYFQHRFKEIVGESPQQFLIRKRLEAAERMLAEGSLSCTEIAYRCGFSNSAQLSTMFKKERKVSPKQYQLDKI